MKIGMIFGGRSEEHEVSVLSAASVLSIVDEQKYEVLLLGIDKEGHWYSVNKESLLGIDSLEDINPEKIFEETKRINISDLPTMIDFAFPVVHGRYGEDGTLQGLLESLGIPYAGCGVTASAIAMDKVFAKMIWEKRGISVVPYAVLYNRDEQVEIPEYPVFVKPANYGSSVGVSRAENAEEFAVALDQAFVYDKKILVEKEVIGSELEMSVVGNPHKSDMYTGSIGEIKPETKFYDYEAKYKSSSTRLIIPAEISPDKADEMRKIALGAYEAIGCEGFARVDCFMDSKTGNIYVNEINTIPGLTKYSMFAQLFRHAGISYRELFDKIVELGYER